MAKLSLDERKLKEMIKAAVVEVFEEKRDMLQELLEESLEEVALVRAIKGGEATKTIRGEEAAIDVLMESHPDVFGSREAARQWWRENLGKIC